MTKITPREAVANAADDPRLPEGEDERLSATSSWGLPYASEHYLALRGMQASSIGLAYQAVWHRDPSGRWTILTTTRLEHLHR